MKQAFAVIAATSMVVTPVVAQAAAVQARTAASVEESENLRGGFIIPLIAVIAVILGILAATNGDDDLPHSP